MGRSLNSWFLAVRQIEHACDLSMYGMQHVYPRLFRVQTRSLLPTLLTQLADSEPPHPMDMERDIDVTLPRILTLSSYSFIDVLGFVST